MSDWFYDASEQDLINLRNTAAELRAYWARMEGMSPTAFDGELSDISALDYFHYEGISLPSNGVEGASLIWGEVIRKALALKWVVSYRGDLMLASRSEDDLYRKFIWPFARVFEVQQRFFPQFGKYNWALEQVVLDMLTTCADDEEEEKLLALIRADHREYITAIAEVMERWR